MALKKYMLFMRFTFIPSSLRIVSLWNRLPAAAVMSWTHVVYRVLKSRLNILILLCFAWQSLVCLFYNVTFLRILICVLSICLFVFIRLYN